MKQKVNKNKNRNMNDITQNKKNSEQKTNMTNKTEIET